MKKITFFILACLSLTACYEDYVKDFEYSSVYVPYQYDLRSFVVGEGMKFNIGVALGGTITNRQDRHVRLVLDTDLVKGDLSRFGGTGPFTALDVLRGSSSEGAVSNAYVTDAFSSVTEIVALPDGCSNLPSDIPLKILAGTHTATFTVRADSLAFLSLEGISTNPRYAIGYRIVEADADTVLLSKSFGVVALRYECMLFGNWYHGGTCVRVNDATGAEIPGSQENYYTKIPSDEVTSAVYSLTTSGPRSVVTNYIGNRSGNLTLTLDGDAVKVSIPDGSITDLGSSWNKRALLQDRQIYLRYKVAGGDGTSTVYTDTLTFRNRMRDGVNEWQDPDVEHYK